ncbi:MAG TPA: TonB-dependent receptor [Terracidiphilus sp.]|nr:TonB-dependent receptor [Terracidiphilus sp.]
MRFYKLHIPALAVLLAFAFGYAVLPVQQSAFAQETTGGLQGTVKDASGAVVPRAKVVLEGTSLVGTKELVTDSSGYYRFANLPPGTYTITVTAQGFKGYKQGGLAIEAGHLPSVDIALQVGAEATTVEVTAAAPVIDVTTTQNMTNLNNQTLQNLPTGITYQSVIQFAPMARDEPLSGMSQNGRGTGGTGGSMPGSSGNGLNFGYSIGGAADSESSYLVEGQDTENISGGYSKANVPMDFIQDEQLTTSGVPAEYGGALGGVVNVVLKKGGNEFHGEVFGTYESSGTDGNPNSTYLRYDPTQTGTDTAALRQDPAYQLYSGQKPHFRTLQPGVLVGGPIFKDRLWFVAGFNPLYNDQAETVNFGANDNSAGNQYFTQDRQTYYTYARLDAALTDRIRVYGSWLYQYAREAGSSFPISDPTPTQAGIVNTSTLRPLSQFSHGNGWSAPDATFNVGADISLTQKLVSTTRYGYFFDNYHDRGWPTSGADLQWLSSSVGVSDNTAGAGAVPTALQQDTGFNTQAYDSSYTLVDADKHYQFNQDFAFFKGGWWGTHNFKFGYQLNHLVNVINQNGNVPLAFPYIGSSQSYFPFTSTGIANCTSLGNEYPSGNCAGQYGYLTVQDFATILEGPTGAPTPASDWNHALYVQDSWNVGKGLTFDVGLRIEHETLPAPGGIKVSAINFPWSDKVAPRLGAAWDPTRTGKMKIFGSYGVVNDVMKLLLAQTSWGAQAYEDCSYPIGPDGTSAGFSTADLNIPLVFKNNRACPTASPTTGANFSTSKVPEVLTDAGTGVTLIENTNFRPWEPVAPGVKPYRQHEYVAGWDYQIRPNLAFEARYDRRRLDHVIEDAALADPFWGEIYTVVNPGEGVNSTLDGYASYLASLGQSFGIQNEEYQFNGPLDAAYGLSFGTCPSCPPMPKAIRNYDGLELRLTLSPKRGWSGMFSYTYSSLWGNYPGLTTTDQTDGGTTGRNSPDTTRAFDEPFYYFGANGKSNAGPMPTDRPSVIKGYGTYTLNWWRSQATTFGLFQQFLQGSPQSSYIDLFHGQNASEPYESVYIFGRGQWSNVTTDGAGNLTLGTPYARRAPWFTQTDFNVAHSIKTGDHEAIRFEGTALNLWNQRAVTSYWGSLDSMNFSASLNPGGQNLSSGAALYQAAETGYNPQSIVNKDGVVLNSQYSKPYLYQNARTIRIGARYTF